jgi:hypothetical protein
MLLLVLHAACYCCASSAACILSCCALLLVLLLFIHPPAQQCTQEDRLQVQHSAPSAPVSADEAEEHAECKRSVPGTTLLKASPVNTAKDTERTAI